MSVFSTELKRLMKSKRLTMNIIAKSSGMNIDQINRIVEGKYEPHEEEKDKLFEHLMMSPSERQRLTEAYDIVKMGKDQYFRLKVTGEFIKSLGHLKQKDQFPIATKYEHRFIDAYGEGVVYNETEINRCIRAVLDDNLQKGKEVKIIAQPNYKFLFDCLISAGSSAESKGIKHIICLENSVIEQKYQYNLNCIDIVLRNYMAGMKYQSQFYYDHVDSHFGVMNHLPYVILTENKLIRISADFQSAYFSENKQLILLFSRVFQDMEKQCKPMMSLASDVVAMFQMYRDEYKDYQAVYLLSAGICVMPFLDKRLIETYLNHRVPNFKLLVAQLSEHAGHLRGTFKKQTLTWFLQEKELRAFIDDGCVSEFPEGFIERPMDLEDRLVILCRILKAAEQGWCLLQIYPDDEQIIPKNWVVVAIKEAVTYLQYNTEEKAFVFQVEEKNAAFSIYDFLKSMTCRRGILSPDSSIIRLREIIAESTSNCI